MSRTTPDIAEERKQQRIDITTLDDHIAAILTEIEQEKVPERLLQLASDLQQALVLHRQREKPN